ncbi:MAG: FkbM family methyltransferase [Bacteroidota bacterium]
MLKKAIQGILQRILGFERYLFYFSRWKIATLKWDSSKKEGDFNFFLTLLNPNDVVLDIGANIGVMSVLMARKCQEGSVFAFEPIPDNFATLQKIISFYGLSNVSAFQLALGDEQKEVNMTMPTLQGVRMQGLSHVEHPSIEGYTPSIHTFTVKQELLDHLPELQNKRVGAIKMDVENYEQFVVKGGQQLLKRDHPILYLELWENENRQTCFDLLQEIGYSVFVLENNQLTAFNPTKHQQHNFFFKSEKVGNHPN